MKNTEFRRQLNMAGMNKRQLSEAMGMHYRTVYDWKDSPPKYVWSYLELAIKCKRAGI